MLPFYNVSIFTKKILTMETNYLIIERNQIHNFISSSGSGTAVINYGSDFLTSYGAGSGSTSPKIAVPVPQHCCLVPGIR